MAPPLRESLRTRGRIAHPGATSTAAARKMRQTGAERAYARAMIDRAERPIATRWSTAADDRGLAQRPPRRLALRLCRIIPGLTLERMIARRGPAWWGRMHARGFRALVARLRRRARRLRHPRPQPRPRRARRPGEIYELYLRPEYQGCGLGRRLFAEARRTLARHGLPRLTVWALSDNEIACRFYRAMGGTEAGRAEDRFCGVPLAKTGFAWG